MALLPVLLDMVDEIYTNLENPENTVGDIPLLFVPHGRRRECPKRKEHGHGHGHGEHGHGHGEHGHGHGEHGQKHGHHKHGHESQSDEDKPEEGRRYGRCGRKEKHGFEGGRCRFAEFKRGGHCPYKAFGSCTRFGGRGCPCKKTSSDDFKVTFDVKSFNLEEITVKVKGREILVDGKHDEREDEQGFVSRQFTRRYVVPDEYDIDTIATYLDAEGKMTITASKPKPVIDESTERIIPIERVASVREETAEASGNIELMDEDTNDSKKTE